MFQKGDSCLLFCRVRKKNLPSHLFRRSAILILGSPPCLSCLLTSPHISKPTKHLNFDALSNKHFLDTQLGIEAKFTGKQFIMDSLSESGVSPRFSK